MADEPTRMSPFGGSDTNALLSQISLLLGRLKELTGSDREVKRALEKFFSSGGRPAHGDMTQDTRFSDQLRAQQERLSVTLRKMNDDLVETEAKLRSNDVTETQKKMLREEIKLKQETIDRERQYKKKIDDATKELDEFNKKRQAVMRNKDSGAITEEQSERYLSIIDRKEAEKVTELKALLDAVRTNIDNQNAQAERRLDTLDHTFRSYADTQEKMKDFLGNQMTAEEAFEKEKDRILTALAQQLQAVTARIKEVDDILKTDSSLTDEQRRNLVQERANLIEQQKTIQKQNKEISNARKRDIDNARRWKDVGEKLKGIPGDIANGLLKATVFDRLNGILTEGFDKVYQSVEKTRNEISARSRLDAGGYKELQNQIQGMIEQQGLEGIVNQVDVNDAITQLSAAGITDTDTLRELAFEQAKLQAEGSSLDLTNEGVITEILGLRSKGVGMDDIRSIIDAYRGQEEVARISGQTYGLERGAGTREFAETLKDMLAFGQTTELASQNVMGRLAGTTAMASLGIDPTVLSTYIADLRDKTLSELSAEEYKFWTNQGYTAESLKTTSVEELEKALIKGMTMYDSANKDNVKYMMQALGSNFTATDLYKLQEADKNTLDDLLTTDKQRADAELKSFRDQAKQGAYESETQKETNKQMNTITETAITMEQFYNGDKLYHSVTDPLLGGMEQIISTIVLTRSIGGGGGGAGGGTGGGTGGGLVGALSGKWGTGASTGVKGIGVGVGAVIAGATVVSDISAADTWQQGLYDATEDPTFWSGIGTAAGSMIAGPLGAAVGGTVGNILGPLVKSGRNLFDKWTDSWVANSDAADTMKAIDERNALQEQAMTESSKYLSDAAAALLASSETLTAEEQSRADVMETLANSSAFADAATNTYSAVDLFRAGDITQSQLPSDWFQQLLDSGLYDLEEDIDNNDALKVQEYALQYFSAKKLMNASGMEAVNAIQSYVDANDGMTYAQAISNIYGESLTAEQSENIVATLETMAKARSAYESSQSKFKDRWESIASENAGKSTEELIAIYSDAYGKDLASALQYDGDNVLMQNGIPVLKYMKSDGSATYNPEYYAGKFLSGLSYVPFDNYPALLHTGERILTAKEASAYNDLSSYAVETLSNSISNSDSSEIEQVFTNSIISGNEGLDDSINSQTTELSSKLDTIITMFTELVKAMQVRNPDMSGLSNVLRMNSNITQLNTTI